MTQHQATRTEGRQVTGPTRRPFTRIEVAALTLVFAPVFYGALFVILLGTGVIDATDLAMSITRERVIAPRDLITSTLVFESVDRIDTDGDGEVEHVLYYKYDAAPGNPVFGATVLNRNACSPRGIDSYHIVRIETSELTARTRNMDKQDIPDVGDANELLLWGSDSQKLKTHLYIYAWREGEDPCVPASPGYLNLGTFRGNGGIEIVGNRVRVKEIIGEDLERSKLALTRVYAPVDGYYSQWIGGPLREPVATAIEFVYPPKPDQPGSHYPERSVLRFYLSIEEDIAISRELLDPQLVQTHINGNNAWDVAEPGQLSSMVDVKDIEYTPNRDVEERHEEVSVKVLVVNRRPDGTMGDPHHYNVWVQGFPNDDALPYYCEWRIVNFELLD